ncbi:MAG TPA: RluA family pseudouridine synthase [Verrucomicrobiae bacterium]|nr:RluA family pseudouridine synthase [Verrucomicrobiae bacterium]
MTLSRRDFDVSSDSAGQRLDRFLSGLLSDLSRTRIQALLDEGRILVDESPRKASYRVQAGESVTVELPAPVPPQVEPEAIPLDVLYEDDSLAVVNKPAGMTVHPGAGSESGTLVAALLHRFGAAGLSTVGGALRPGIVHRLDKGTSGALVVARTDAAHLRLVEAFRDRLVEKIYIALLHGNLKGQSGSIALPVARDLRRRSRMTARRREGRSARTDWRVVRHFPGPTTLIEAGLHTGRTHQIRVHFSALGSPVVGDTLYGAPRQERIEKVLLAPLGRNFLHAARLSFDHPFSGKPIAVRAPLPRDLVAYLGELAAAAKIDTQSFDAALAAYL